MTREDMLDREYNAGYQTGYAQGKSDYGAKTGHWIVRVDNTSFVKQFPRRWVECSCCGWSFSFDRIKDDFCSKCGANMEDSERYVKISIDNVMSVFDDFMCGEVDEEDANTFLNMLKDKAESEEENDT